MIPLKVKSSINIPFNKSRDFAVNCIIKGNFNSEISMIVIRRCTLFAITQIQSLFKGPFYDQVDGVACSFPLVKIKVRFTFIDNNDPNIS